MWYVCSHPNNVQCFKVINIDNCIINWYTVPGISSEQVFPLTIILKKCLPSILVTQHLQFAPHFSVVSDSWALHLDRQEPRPPIHECLASHTEQSIHYHMKLDALHVIKKIDFLCNIRISHEKSEIELDKGGDPPSFRAQQQKWSLKQPPATSFSESVHFALMEPPTWTHCFTSANSGGRLV